MDVEISAGPAFAFGEIRLPPDGAVRVWLQTRSSIDLIQWLTTKLPKDHS